MSRVLVTGAAGFLGGAVCRAAVDRDDTVHGLVRFGELRVPTPGVHYLAVDWSDRSDIVQALSQIAPDVIVHCAGATPRATLGVSDYYDANVGLTWKLLDAARETLHGASVVVISSAGVYGSASSVPITEDDPTDPASHYAWSKLIAEQTTRAFVALDDVRVCVARIFNLLGVDEPLGSVVSDIAQQLDSETGCEVLHLRETKSVRDYLNVDDAAEALLILAERGQAGEVYNVSSGTGTSIGSLVDMMLRTWDMRPVIEVADPSFAGTTSIGSSQKLRALGWTPQSDVLTALRQIHDVRAL